MVSLHSNRNCISKASPINGENKIFHDKSRFKQYLSINPALQEIIEGKPQPRNPTTPTIAQTSDNPPPIQLKEGKHTNTTTKKITGVNIHWSLILLNINGLNSPIKKGTG